jgi:superoxide reductase
MSYYLCTICGHISFGSAPDACPVCTAPKDKFKQNDSIFTESKAKSPEGGVKHTPVISIEAGPKLWEGAEYRTVNVKIGEVAHPMEDKHFITFIDIYADEKWIKRIHFTPAVYAAAAAHIKGDFKKITAIENCNLHGWWINEKTL